MKIAFLGHELHRKTKSSDFFVEFLKTLGEVEHHYVRNEKFSLDDPIFEIEADIVVVWQLEFWALGFIQKGYRVLIAPMYDGSGSRPKEHWQLFRGASFISFSLALHRQVQAAGCRSFLLKYFPEIEEEVLPKTFERKRVFLWQRRPSSGINLDLINRLFGRAVDGVHIHLAADPGEPKYEPLDFSLDYPFTVSFSSWFDNRADLTSIINSCNIYIAPRPSEGIGMGFLEAMANGSVVFAHDLPTHSEYIANWMNGVLFHKDNTRDVPLDPNALANMSKHAITTCRIGRESYEATLPAVAKFINTTPNASERAVDLDVSDFEELTEAATRENTFYLPVLHEFIESHPALSKQIEIGAATRPDKARLQTKSVFLDRWYPTIVDMNQSVLANSWQRSEAKLTWNADDEALLLFQSGDAIGSEDTKDIELELELRTTGQLAKDGLKLTVSLNGQVLGELEPTDAVEKYKLQVPKGTDALSVINMLNFHASGTDDLPGRKQKTAFALAGFGFKTLS